MLRKQKLLSIIKSHAQYPQESILKSALTSARKHSLPSCGGTMPPKTATSNSSKDISLVRPPKRGQQGGGAQPKRSRKQPPKRPRKQPPKRPRKQPPKRPRKRKRKKWVLWCRKRPRTELRFSTFLWPCLRCCEIIYTASYFLPQHRKKRTAKLLKAKGNVSDDCFSI